MQSTQLGCTVVFGGGPGGLQWYTQNWWQEKKGCQQISGEMTAKR